MAKSKVIKELANNEISMEIALNRLLVIASDLDNNELADWAEAELRGYKTGDALPSYRQTKSMQFIYSGINGSFQVKNSPFTYLSIIQEHVPNAFDVRITDSISALQNAVDKAETQSYYRDFTYLSGYVYDETGIQCTHIRQKIPINCFQNILGEIKARLLKVFLKLDKEYGCLDELDIDTSTKTTEDVEQINRTVNNYIYIDNSVRMGDKNKLENTDILSGGK